MEKIVIIPLGGLGIRFKEAGYNLPKPLINVMGQPILYWLLENLDLTDIKYVCIPYAKELKKYRFEERLRKDFSGIPFRFLCLENKQRGAAETVKLALEDLALGACDAHIMCIDSDNFYTENFMPSWNGGNMIVSFEDHYSEPVFSYVRVNGDGVVTDIKEKSKISDFACSGIYAFESARELLDCCGYVMENGIMERGEFYMSVVIGQMIRQRGAVFYNRTVCRDNYHCLGTPVQVKIFCSEFGALCTRLGRSLVKKKRYCFDLDNTLVTFPRDRGDYGTVEPIWQNIRTVRYLHGLGHTIIIYTARRMNTCGGNVGRVLAEVGKVTIDTLDRFEVPYDELVFGKPYADYYIDDLAISAYDNLEKAFGYHDANVSPRDHNVIEKTDLDVTKRSVDLSAEIEYYLGLPEEIRGYFPVMLDYGRDWTWYRTEKVSGVLISKLYLAEEMTTSILGNIMNGLEKIQGCGGGGGGVGLDIYANYGDKVKKRYDGYDYSRFGAGHREVYDSLMAGLEAYKEQRKGRMSVIHGDPVFTNIFLDSRGGLKFIDMRGKLGDVNTIFGDWLYDWAKVYQSLIGYDEILGEVDVNLVYKDRMVGFFREEFVRRFGSGDFCNLRLIVKSLLFSLIPIHGGEKCDRYYGLIGCGYL